MQPTMLQGSDFALLAEWRDYLRANGKAPRTIYQYTYAVWRLIEHLDFRVDLLDVTPPQIAGFLASLGDHAPARYSYAKGLKVFYSYACDADYLLSNPMRLSKPRPPRRVPAEDFDRDELTRLLIAAAVRNPRRAWAMLACVALGTRRSELVYLRLQDVDWDRGIVRLRKGVKGGRSRDVPLSPWAAEALTELLATSDGDRFLPILPNTFTEWVHQASIDCGFPDGRKRRSHTLRATFATWLMRDGVPMHVVKELLGHESLATTGIYGAVRADDSEQAVQLFQG